MLLQYIKIALRNARKRPGYTFIHYFGLAVGMAACLLLLRYIGFELSFDRHFSKADSIYRIINERYQNGEMVQKGPITYPTVGPTIMRDYPEVVNATRFFGGGGEWIKPVDGTLQQITGVYYVDDAFLQIFDHPRLAQASDTLLNRSREIVITESFANNWFDVRENDYNQILGELLEVDGDSIPFTISGVIADVPENSHLDVEVLISYQTLIESWGEGVDQSWTWSDFYHYVELAPGVDHAAFSAKLTDFSDRYFRGSEVSGADETFYLQPLLDAHLYSTDLEYDWARKANGNSIWALLIIAFFILLIAWINYANLTASRALERSQEVGLRKVVGASNQQLLSQFLIEALLANGVSLGLALGLVAVLRPFVEMQLQVDMSTVSLMEVLQQHPALGFTALGLAVLGLSLSALYPSWVLSSQQMASVVKGYFSSQGRGRSLQQGLIIFQFTASIALIAGTLLVYHQIRFMQQKDLGVDIDQVMVIQSPDLSNFDNTFINRMDILKDQFAALQGVEVACTSSRVPGNGIGRIFGLTLPSAEDDRNHTFGFINVDHNYTETYQLEILAGRALRPEDHSNDFSQIENLLINEAGVRTLGFENNEAAIGQVVNTYGKDWTIVGVIPDFHQLSLHNPIDPVLLQPLYDPNNPISVRLSSSQVGAAIPQLRALYDAQFPGNAFSYTFLDEQFAQQYTRDRQFGQMLLFFTLLTIVVACLGLVGLAAYAAQLRTKEISIRKILGAGTARLVLLLSGNFLKLIVVAIVIGLPLAWWGIQYWLRDYAYTASIRWWTFPLAALAGLGVALLTVSYHALRAAWVNPAEQLRGE
ncbi:MAG: ABC transporter permease [Bacteroidota bacterium]